MEKEDQVRTLHIDKFMGTGTLHPRVWGSWLRSLRGQLFLKGHGGRKRFLKKVGKQMALRFSTRVSREIWGPCQKAVETNWKAWNSTWTQGNTVEQVAQRQREVPSVEITKTQLETLLGVLLCLTLLEQGGRTGWLQRSVCCQKAGTSGFCVCNCMQWNSSEHEMLPNVNPNLRM